MSDAIKDEPVMKWSFLKRKEKGASLSKIHDLRDLDDRMVSAVAPSFWPGCKAKPEIQKQGLSSCSFLLKD